jgi:hypothetical protein
MNNVPSAAAQIIVTIIPMVGIVMGSGIAFFYLLWNYKAKRSLIERGIYNRTEFDFDTFSLFAGLVLTGTGTGLMLFFLIKTGFSYGILSGLIPLSCGISLLVFFGIRLRVRKKHG